MGKNERDENTTAVTKVSRIKRQSDHPIMSYTAVTSHQTMAEAFVNELLRSAQSLIPDHPLTAEDLVAILQRTLNNVPNDSVTMVSGRHLRARISEQVSRAKRYHEPFSVIVLNLDNILETEDYEAIVDTLKERMRQTDLIFLFKHRIVLLLPHTPVEPCKTLLERIQQLLKGCISNIPEIDMSSVTYPNPLMKGDMDMLDWTENALRS